MSSLASPSEDGSQSPRANTRTRRAQNDGINQDNVVVGRRNGRSSLKQVETDQEKCEKMQKQADKQRKKIAQLKKQLNQLEAAHTTKSSTFTEEPGEDFPDEDIDPESEDDDSLPVPSTADPPFVSQGVFKASRPQALPRNSARKPSATGRKQQQSSANSENRRGRPEERTNAPRDVGTRLRSVSVVSVVSLPPASPRESSASSRPLTPSPEDESSIITSSEASRRPLRQRSHSRDSPSRRKRTRLQSPPRPLEQLRLKKGREPKQGHSPLASDFEKSIELLINNAVARFHVKILTTHAYPGLMLATEWAQEAWLVICKDAKRYFSSDDTAYIARVITNRASSGRSHFRGAVRQHVNATFGLTIEAPEGSSKRDANLRKLEHLRSGQPPRFCFKDWQNDNPVQYAEVPMIAQVVQSSFFQDSDDVGMNLHHQFSPMPLPLIAFFMTCMHCSLDAWSSGGFDKEHKMSKSYISKYDVHLNNTKDWRSEHPELVDKLREKMFARVLVLGNLKIDGVEPSHVRRDVVKKRFAAALKDRTGDTDSE